MNEHQHPYDEELRARIEAEFDAFYGRLEDAVSLIDIHVPFRPIVACNEAFARMHGYEKEELLGQKHDILHPSAIHTLTVEHDTETRHRLIEQHHQEGYSAGQSFHVHKSGEQLRIDFYSIFIHLAGRELMLATDTYHGSASSISQQTSFSQFFRKLSESMTEAVLIVEPTPQLKVLDCNISAMLMTGWEREEIVGHTLWNFSPDQNMEAYEKWRRESLTYYIAALRHTQFVSWQLACPRRDGSVFPVFLINDIVEHDGREYLLYVVRNLTEQQQRRRLDTQRGRVLASITSNTGLSETLRKINSMIEQQAPGTAGAIFLKDGQLNAPLNLSQTQSNQLEELCHQYCMDSIQRSLASRVPVYTEFAHVHEQTHKHEFAQKLRQLNTQANAYWIIPLPGAEASPGVLFLLLQPDNTVKHVKQVEAIQQAISLASIAIEQQRFTKHLEYQAEHDHLTGLPNRLLLEDRLKQALFKAERDGDSLALLMLDLDGFKRVNDTLGHSAGDWLLQQVSERLQSCVRRSDTVARMGGDEFTILLANFQNAADVTQVAQKIINAIQQPFRFRDHDIFVTTSIGIAIAPRDGNDVSTLLRNADTAMYRAKTSGKNRLEFFASSMNEALERKLDLTRQLRDAMARGEFEIYYQPQIRLGRAEDGSGDRVVGFEALLRWRHPKLGIVLPPRFIPTAEESGVILEIGSWAINEVCRQISQWQSCGLGPFCVAINISALQFGRKEFLHVIQSSLSTHNVAPEWLEMDLTEDVVMRDQIESQRQISRLHELGVRLAIDDFGTGYSSLSYLQKLPLNRIKMDESFVRNLKDPEAVNTLAQAIITLGHSLQLQVLAEGVVNLEQLRILRQSDCDLVQGFYIAHPMPACEVADFVENYDTTAFCSA